MCGSYKFSAALKYKWHATWTPSKNIYSKHTNLYDIFDIIFLGDKSDFKGKNNRSHAFIAVGTRESGSLRVTSTTRRQTVFHVRSRVNAAAKNTVIFKQITRNNILTDRVRDGSRNFYFFFSAYGYNFD